MKLAKLKENKISETVKLLPEKWNPDLERLVAKYSDNPDYYPLTAEVGGKTAAFGQAMIFEKTAWLGNIIVDPDFRKQGIASLLTEELMDYCYKRGALSLQLTSTDAASSLYKKLGFVEDSLYLFFWGNCDYIDNGRIVPIENSDFRTILNINYRVTGEVKDSILTEYLSTGYKYIDRYKNIAGFYLPLYGNGMILAMDDIAGTELLRFKHSRNETMSVLSEENQAGVEFLEDMNFTKVSKSTRMYHGEYTTWHPDMTFSRGSSYAG